MLWFGTGGSFAVIPGPAAVGSRSNGRAWGGPLAPLKALAGILAGR